MVLCSRNNSQTEGDMGSVNRSAPKLSQKGKRGSSGQAVGPAFPGSEGSFMEQSHYLVAVLSKLGVSSQL